MKEKCDWAPQKGVKCPNSVLEKWSLKDEMFQKRDVQIFKKICDVQKMKCFRNVTFETKVFKNVSSKMKCFRNVTFET